MTSSNSGKTQTRNAFAELMSKKAEDPYKPKFKGHCPRPHDFNRDVLGPYLDHPENLPADQVVYHNDDFVVINDMYPKSTIHCLVMPRDKDKNTIHPIVALDDPEFLEKVRLEVAKAKDMIAKELQRRHGGVSATDRARVEAMPGDVLPEKLPRGRDWTKDIKCGFHAQPSMNHLHVHVLSVDMNGPALKRATQYIAFNSPYFIQLDEFPLALDDWRRDTDSGPFEELLKGDLVCWRCESNHGRKFAQFKDHLQTEFETWRRE